MTIIYKDGDLLEADEKIICHQVNFQGRIDTEMGVRLSKKYPNKQNEGGLAYYYIKSIDAIKELLQKHLGELEPDYWKFIKENGAVYFHREELTKDGKIIASIFGRFSDTTDYDALRNGLIFLRKEAEILDATIAFPHKIGCDTGKAKWKSVKKMIEDIFEDFENDVVIYKLA